MKQQLNYNPGINFLRAISIIGIVLYHIFPFTFSGGFMGVCFFFIISGYLAAKQGEVSWANQEFSYKKYYIKKAKRIYPALYIMVMSVIAFFTLFHQEMLLGVREEAASIFLGVNNWWQMVTHASYFMQITEHSPFTHLWYMGVEMELLLVWPLLFVIYKKCRESKMGKASVLIFLFLIAASIGLMAGLYSRENINRVYYGTDTRAFAFFMGVVLGICEDTWKEKMPTWIKGTFGKCLCVLLLAVAICMFFFIKGEYAWLYYGGMAGICLLYTFLIFVMNCCCNDDSLISKGRIMQMIGRHSYLIYLWHYPILFILMYLY